MDVNIIVLPAIFFMLGSRLLSLFLKLVLGMELLGLFVLLVFGCLVVIFPVSLN